MWMILLHLCGLMTAKPERKWRRKRGKKVVLARLAQPDSHMVVNGRTSRVKRVKRLKRRWVKKRWRELQKRGKHWICEKALVVGVKWEELVRTVHVKTKTSNFSRPVSKVVKLEGGASF